MDQRHAFLWDHPRISRSIFLFPSLLVIPSHPCQACCNLKIPMPRIRSITTVCFSIFLIWFLFLLQIQAFRNFSKTLAMNKIILFFYLWLIPHLEKFCLHRHSVDIFYFRNLRGTSSYHQTASSGISQFLQTWLCFCYILWDPQFLDLYNRIFLLFGVPLIICRGILISSSEGCIYLFLPLCVIYFISGYLWMKPLSQASSFALSILGTSSTSLSSCQKLSWRSLQS